MMQYQQPFPGKDFNNIILPPPVQKVVLPPASQIWDYRLANQLQLNYNTNGAPPNNTQANGAHPASTAPGSNQMQQQQFQQLQAQMQMPQMNYITSPTMTNTGTTNTTPSPTSTPLAEQPHMFPSAQGLLPSISNEYTTTSAKSASISSSISGGISKPSKTKPRKKKQCPECHLFFSNLSTHKSIHLNPSSRPYLCQICGRGFSRSNDLFRHSKRHWRETGIDQGAFKCPFNTALLNETNPELAMQQDPQVMEAMPCHPTGIFSRCDTYKNHLKALHFEYPAGTKKKMRNQVGGNCKFCGKHFRSVNEWLDLHVETGNCGWSFDNDEGKHSHDH